MAGIAEDKIEEVRSRADIVEVIGAHVRLRRTGRNFTGLCPFHQEKTPSFSVNPERGFFHCFGCGAGGSVFNFVMKVEGLTFPEAVRSLARKYGVEIPEYTPSGGPAPGERDAMVRANEVAAEFFAHVLWNTGDGALAREYLERRGITAETAHAFRLGYAPARVANLANALDKRKLRDAGIKLGLVRKDADGVRDMFRARVMFPIRDVQGRVVAFGGRVLDSRLPKYINSPESPLYSKTRTLYGLYESRQGIAARDRAILVEGYVDVIALWQAGFKEVVAGCGTAITVEQLRILARHTKNVLACFDGDDAGRKASLRALEIFLEAGLLGRAIFIPPGFDPDTFVKDRGAQAFAELADHAELLIDFFLAGQAEAAGTSMEARAKAADRVAEVLRAVKNPFEFDLLARKAAPLLGVGEELLRREGRLTRPAPWRERVSEPPAAGVRPRTTDAGARAEIGLVALALFCPELRGEMSDAIDSSAFDTPELAAAFSAINQSDAFYTTLEWWTAEHLSADQQSRISEFAVGTSLDDLAQSRLLMKDFVAALSRRRNQRDVDSLRREARAAQSGSLSDDAAAAAQAVIAIRRSTLPN